MTLKTLGDVRILIERHLPQHFRAKATWRYVAARLAEAARGGHGAILDHGGWRSDHLLGEIPPA